MSGSFSTTGIRPCSAADQTNAQRWNGRATVHEVLASAIGLHRSHAPEW
jgi:hypothetical protein